MKKIIRSLFAILMLTIPTLAVAEIAVIVHPSAAFDSLTEDDVARIFLEKVKVFLVAHRQYLLIKMKAQQRAINSMKRSVRKMRANTKPIGLN